MKPIRCLICALLLPAAFLLSGCVGGEDPAPGAAAPSETVFSEHPELSATFRETTVFYLSDDGFIVPVTKLIPWEEGIAKAALSCMVSTPANVSAAREMGLSTVIPEGAELSISIADGNAKVDISGIAPLPSREAEDAMLRSIVNTLTGFPTVSTVTVTRDGEGGSLENGAELPVRQEAYALNPEEPEAETAAGGAEVTLYFPNAGGSLAVPVTRRISGRPGLYQLVSALVSGARSGRLRSCFPENTLLLGATLENGTVTVNLSEDFRASAQTEGLFSLAYRTVWLTLSREFDFDSLRFQINGVDFNPEEVGSALLPNPAA